MSALTLELKQKPLHRIDLSALVPAGLAGMKQKEIEALNLSMTRVPVAAAEIFKVTAGDVEQVRLVGTTSLCDKIGKGMAGGELVVEGDAGAYLGSVMQGGRITLTGSAGAYAGGGMQGGEIAIGGDVGERAGGIVVGSTFGMQGGRMIIGGNAGPMLGERMRRGQIMVQGNAGDYTGGRVLAGTIIVGGELGRYAGYGLRRGTLLLRHEPKQLLPTFGDCGVLDFNYLRLLSRSLKGIAGFEIGHRARRLMGDMAALGKGEMLILA